MGLQKYLVWARYEQSLPAATTQQHEVLSFEAPEDGTVVGIIAELAIGFEEPTSGNNTAAVAGYARLVVNRAGNTIPTVLPNVTLAGSLPADWDAVGASDTLQDADTGDTWAIQAIGHGPGATTRVLLVPKTKRKLRRQDKVSLETNLSNGGGITVVMNTSAIGQLWYQT